MKKILSLILLATISLMSLIGCTKVVERPDAGELLRQAFEKRSNAKSQEWKAMMDSEIEFTAEGMKITVEPSGEFDYKINAEKNAVEIKGTVEAKLLGQKQEQDFHMIISMDEQNVHTYSKENGVWKKTTQPFPNRDLEEYSKKVDRAFLDKTDIKLLDGTKEVYDKECYIIENTIDFEEISKLFNVMSEGRDFEDFLKTMDIKVDDMNFEMEEQFAIDVETGELVSYTVDLSGMFKALMDKAMEMQGGSDFPVDDFSINVEKAIIEIVVVEYNGDIDIEIPTVK